MSMEEFYRTLELDRLTVRQKLRLMALLLRDIVSVSSEYSHLQPLLSIINLEP